MAKTKLPDPFQPATCERLRYLAKLRARAITGKKKAIEERDEIETAIAECDKSREASKIDRLKGEWFDAMHEVKRCSTLIKMCDSKIMETIENGDDLELIETINPRPTEASLFKEAKADIEADDDEDDDGEGAGDRQLSEERRHS